ncbi:glycine zipper 2TM domain-containing protein [Stenotrophomonas sp. SG1]|uniref:glycine zipper 2TM domain-containing protein n=1 Tax=Stenotrophomonas sp. SG1 TaxID=2944932 RepID=UPI0022447FCF|nr:glycine zipper 2TM domain-containing protein [Stenotrophomonas sp. SG1]MCW8340608.1 glycine zipper 2TM domain-containing protein [Stenotrophomonas sp. SG1]
MRSLLYSIAMVGVLLSGAAAADSNTSPRNYSREQALRARTVQEGVIVMVRPVRIDNRSTVNTGAVLGAAVGAGAAQRVKNRGARTAARIIGTTAGAVAGSAIQRSATHRQGVEIFIRTQARNGQTNVISVV